MAPFFPTLQKFTNLKIEHKNIGLYTGLVYGADSAGILFLIPIMGLIMNFNAFIAYDVPLISLFIIFSLVLTMKGDRVSKI